MNLLFCAVFSFLAIGLNASLLIKDLPKRTYEVDEIITIEWIGKEGEPNDLLTIDLINDRPEVMIEPFLIIQDLFVKQKSYNWKIPRYLKSSGDYHLRIYLKGSQPVVKSKEFSIVNPNPMRSSTLNLLEPTGSADGKNLESTCLIGEQCYVLWDYPDWAETAMPKLVDIKLYSSNCDRMVMVLAQGVPVGTKSFLWRVPENEALKREEVYVVVSAADKALRPLKPGESYYLASAGYPFKLETRGEREERRLARKKEIDFTAPGPIQKVEESSGNSGFLDVPRPTYAGVDSGNKVTSVTVSVSVTGTSTSAGSAVEPLSIGFSLLTAAIFILAF